MYSTNYRIAPESSASRPPHSRLIGLVGMNRMHPRQSDASSKMSTHRGGGGDSGRVSSRGESDNNRTHNCDDRRTNLNFIDPAGDMSHRSYSTTRAQNSIRNNNMEELSVLSHKSYRMPSGSEVGRRVTTNNTHLSVQQLNRKQDQSRRLYSESLPDTDSSRSASMSRTRQQCFKTRMCHFFLQQKCSRGNNCVFAHSPTEVRLTPDLSKTKICVKWKKSQCVADSSQCSYSHGVDDLRPGILLEYPEVEVPQYSSGYSDSQGFLHQMKNQRNESSRCQSASPKNDSLNDSCQQNPMPSSNQSTAVAISHSSASASFSIAQFSQTLNSEVLRCSEAGQERVYLRDVEFDELSSHGVASSDIADRKSDSTELTRGHQRHEDDERFKSINHGRKSDRLNDQQPNERSSGASTARSGNDDYSCGMKTPSTFLGDSEETQTNEMTTVISDVMRFSDKAIYDEKERRISFPSSSVPSTSPDGSAIYDEFSQGEISPSESYNQPVLYQSDEITTSHESHEIANDGPQQQIYQLSQFPNGFNGECVPSPTQGFYPISLPFSHPNMQYPLHPQALQMQTFGQDVMTGPQMQQISKPSQVPGVFLMQVPPSLPAPSPQHFIFHNGFLVPLVFAPQQNNQIGAYQQISLSTQESSEV